MKLFEKNRAIIWLFLSIAISLVILFAPIFFQGKVIVPGDIPYTNQFWADELDAGQFIPPQNPLLGDQINQFFLWHTLVSNSFRESRPLPLWNPYVFTGQPLAGNAQSALFYPPNLLLRWLSPGLVANIRNIFNLVIAALFTFLFSHTINISGKGSILAAMAFMLSGPLIVWLGHPHSNVLVLLPLLMWASEKLIRRPSPGWVGVLATGVGFSFLGGHPETTFHVIVFTSFYILLRLIFLQSNLREKFLRAGAAVLGGLLGLLLGAIQTFPFVDFLLQSATLASGGRSMGGENWFYSSEWLPNLTTSITAIYPNFFGNPVTYNYHWPFSTYQNYNEQTIYFGLIPLAMIFALLLSRPRNPLVWIVFGLAIFSLAIAWRIPGFEAVNHLPIFSISLNKRLKMIFAFFAAVSSGFGFDAFLSYLETKRGNASIFYGAAFVMGLTWIILLAIIGIKYLYVPTSGFLYQLCFQIFSLRQIRIVIPALTAIGFAVLSFVMIKLRWSKPPAIGYCLIALTVTELVILAWQYNPMIAEEYILPSTPIVEMLQADNDEPFRLLAMNDIFWPNYPLVFGLESVDGYDLPVDRWYSDLFKAQGGLKDYQQHWQPDWPMIDFVNIKYILATEALSLTKLRLIDDYGSFKIYENLTALPRAFMVYNVKVISKPTKWLTTVLTNHETLGKVAYLAEMPPDFVAAGKNSVPEAQVKFVSRSENQTTIAVVTEQSGLLVSSDLYSKDWQAKIDGKTAKVYRANYAFRAVNVPAGEHTIQFVYQPFWFLLGRITTLIALVIIVFSILFNIGHIRNHDK